MAIKKTFVLKNTLGVKQIIESKYSLIFRDEKLENKLLFVSTDPRVGSQETKVKVNKNCCKVNTNCFWVYDFFQFGGKIFKDFKY